MKLDSLFMGLNDPPVSSGDPFAIGLVHYWKCNEGTGQTRVDSGSIGQDLPDKNGDCALEAAGPFGYCVVTSATGPKMLHKNGSGTFWDHSSDWTMGFWVYIDSGVLASGDDAITGDTETAISIRHQYTTTSTRSIRGQLLTGGSKYTDTLDDTAWSYVVIKYESGTLYISKNGEAFGAGDSSVTPVAGSTSRFAVGGYSFTGTANGDFKFAEIAVWNRGLTDSEVATMYNGGSGREITV